MFLIRQSFQDDGDQILAVARYLDSVNLPAKPEHIAKILELSRKSFAQEIPPQEREYLFVLEDVETGRVVGTSMIHAQHGTRRAPHVFFEVFDDERYSETLDRYFVHQCLRMRYNHDGPTEIAGLILLPEFRGHPQSLGKLLSYTRFLFIAMHRSWFRDHLLSELLPPLPNGQSVLWEHLGRRFTGLSYQEADLLSKDNKEFIRALFPHSRIYTSLFPKEVQEVIGVVGPETRGVEKMLRRVGFEYAHQIDPFDGGPHFVARTDKVTLVRDSAQLLAQAAGDEKGSWGLIATWRQDAPTRFRCTTAPLRVNDDQVFVPPTAMELVDVRPGEPVWVVIP